RIYPTGSVPLDFKQWSYNVQKIQYPPDILEATDWRLAESPTDQNPSWIWIDADTEGVDCQVLLKNEAGTVITVAQNGTVADRRRNYPIPVDIRAKMWRLVNTPGSGGKFQLFTWGFQRWMAVDYASGADPTDTILWTPWNAFGYPCG